MWRLANAGDFKGFKEIGSEFMKLNASACRYIPIRIAYLKKSNGIISRPFPANEMKTVRDAVTEVAQGFEGKIIVQGVEVPGEAELFWLWRNMSHPDNFLYITLLD